MIPPPRWTQEQLENDIQLAIANFRRERMQEPLEAYFDAFEEYRGFVEDLLEASVDLAEIDKRAVEVLTNPNLLEAFRYIAGPPLSEAGLKTLGEAVLTPSRLRKDPAMVRRIVEVVRMGLDRRRFPWISENREPAEEEKAAAVLASASLMATRRVGTARRQESKDAQELLVENTLITSGLTIVDRRPIQTLNNAPNAGEFCRESLLGSRNADIVVRLWDHRIMPIECKVSNSALNSIKRVNNDAAIKAETWIKDFGTRNIIPAAALSGVYKLRHLMDAQHRGLTLFWAHNLQALVSWIEETR
ncbi:MAG: XamI family restriction endonuclease [Bryobacteraceae bacterium]